MENRLTDDTVAQLSTEMSEADWTHKLGMFRACLSLRCRKAQDDRQSLRIKFLFNCR